jgi:thiol:disulfide interchange protein DsbC
MTTFRSITKLAFGLVAMLVFHGHLHAQEAQIRKSLASQLPQFPAIEEVRKTSVSGLFELRVRGSEIYYTDAKGQYLIQGNIIDISNKKNLTQERTDKLQALDFNALPRQDAITIVRGKGERKLAVFADPNCGYCKQFEQQIQSLDNVTISVFLYPILGEDSTEKSKRIWCAKDQSKVWNDWMVKDKSPGKSSCDTAALQRNLEWGQKNNVKGTPMLVLADGSRIPGAIDLANLEKRLAPLAK